MTLPQNPTVPPGIVPILGANETRMVAVAATIILVLVIIWVIHGGGKVVLSNGTKVSPWKAAIIDKATNTYSLSKLQLYIWQSAAASVYLYLLATNIFIYRNFLLVDIPSGILALSALSAATTVASTGVNSLSGGKGSGPFQPSPLDLVSSGGDVAPERVQQLLWTLIAAPAFVFFAYMTDPSHLNAVPELTKDFAVVKPEFLQLMGLSATAYVAGKVARGPGPKITAIAASAVNGPPPFLLLSITCSDIQTQGASFTLLDNTNPNATAIALPASFLGSSVIDSTGLATSLNLSLPSAGLRQAASGTTWGYMFSVATADGETAQWEF